MISRCNLGLRWQLIYLVLLVTVSFVHAHPDLQNSLLVDLEPSRIRLEVNVSVKELSVAHGITGLPVNGVGRLDTAAIQRAAEAHRAYALSHLKVSTGQSVLAGEVTQLRSPPFFGDPTYTFYQYQIDYPLLVPLPRELRIDHDMLKEWPYSAGTSWNVSYAVRLKQSIGPSPTTWLLRAKQPISIATGWETAIPAAAVPAAPAGWRNFREYLWHGVTHILTGYDHLLFVTALVIGSISFWQMAKVIAAFTIAHSLTLVLCVFGIVRLPSSIIEPLIAGSIVVVALGNLFHSQPRGSHARLAAAFGFGLIHGLGFAGGLLGAMEGLPLVGVSVALIGFSLGVEIGHQAVVIPVFTLLSQGRRKLSGKTTNLMNRYLSVLIVGCGIYYLIVALK
jgi:HupE / UreJ protein